MSRFLEILIISASVFLIVMSANCGYHVVCRDVNQSWLAMAMASGHDLLVLVNKQNSIDNYAPTDLVSLAKLGASSRQIRQVVYPDLSRMLSDAKSQGVNIKIISAYRSFSRQSALFGYYQKHFSNADTFSARAGYSEHQLGTTLDFGTGNAKIDLTAKFADTSQGQWLAQHAWQYGFMMSYPQGQQAVTGYIYEPWHFRYIGLGAAAKCHNSGLVLQQCLMGGL